MTAFMFVAKFEGTLIFKFCSDNSLQIISLTLQNLFRTIFELFAFLQRPFLLLYYLRLNEAFILSIPFILYEFQQMKLLCAVVGSDVRFM